MEIKEIKEIKVIIWDIDGTIWRNENLGEVIKQEFINYLAGALKKSREEARALFNHENKKWHRWSKVVEILTGIEEKQIIVEIEKRIDKSRFLREDKKLIEIFRRIKGFRHLILTNATFINTLNTLRALGFPIKDKVKNREKRELEFPPFEKIFTLEQTTVVKPEKEAFLKVLEYTKLPPEAHLMVGDLPEIDLIPARTIGMKTCLVWGSHPLADICLPDIYKFPEILSGRIGGKERVRKFKNLLKKIWRDIHPLLIEE